MKSHTVCREREREREKTPILYKRDWSWDAVLVVTGLGAGVASSATSSTIIMSSTWASVVPAGKVPKDTTPTTSTASLPVLARRFLADPHEIGRFEGIGPDLWELGAASTRASVGREPVTAEDCGSGVSNWARTPTGFDSSSHPPEYQIGTSESFLLLGPATH